MRYIKKLQVLLACHLSHFSCDNSPVRKEVTLLSSIFNMAKAERLVGEDPCDFIRKTVKKKIPTRRRRGRAMTVAEENLLAPQFVGRREHLLPVVRVALWTGMRRGRF
jgi:hypothetical protein